ncbi:Xrcc6 [Acrasis kona]|uniref:Xrcc6 n=1 Tax=Acrasis kona TaxID=1008807 RepID=A0AAW2ZMN5_9EUKA
MKLKSTKLKELCKKHGQKTAPTKQEMVTRLMEKVKHGQEHNEISDIVLNRYRTLHFKNNATHHDMYRSSFNGVDRSNKWWYKSNYAYALNNWRTKMLLSILQDMVANAFVLMRDSRKIHISDFREELSTQLMLYKE